MNSLQILTLGQAAGQINGQPVQWHSASARKLFFYLLSKHTGQNRDAILETLWGLEVNALNSNRFRVNVHRVRMALGARDNLLEPFGFDFAGFPLDIYEEGENLVVKASIPGLKPEDLKVEVRDDILTIYGEPALYQNMAQA